MNTIDSPAAEQIHPQLVNVAHADWALKLFRVVVRAIFKALFRVRVVGLGNVPHKPAIVCANHLGWTDAFLVLLFLPLEPRIYALGERQVANISRFRNMLIKRLQVMIPLDRDKPREALRVMSDVLKNGGSLLIFPEGQLGTQEGELQPLQHGAPHLSLHSDTPILPVGLTGTSKLWLRHTLTIRIGAPIDPTQFTGDLRTRLNTLTWQLDRDMRALLPGAPPPAKIRLLSKWLTDLF